MTIEHTNSFRRTSLGGTAGLTAAVLCALVFAASIVSMSRAATPEVEFKVFTTESAPEGSRDAMTRLKKSAGLVPNLAGAMSASPTLIDGFVTLREITQRGWLDPKQREILGLSAAVENRCEWCVAFHSFVALKMGIDRGTVDAVRGDTPPADPKMRALDQFARQLIQRRGAVTGQDLDDFTKAGFTKEQALEVVSGLALYMMADYAGNFGRPPLDGFLAEHKWSPKNAQR